MNSPTKSLWRVGVLSVSLGLLLSTGAAEAQQDRVHSARQTVEQADEAWDRGEYALALRLFGNAYLRVQAPTIAVRQAECLEKLGRLVRALEVYDSVGQWRLDSSSPEPFRRAVATALERAILLRGRVPSLRVTFYGEDVDGADVMVDGKPIAKELYRDGFLVDPGEHTIKVVKGNRWGATRLRTAEGARVHAYVFLPGKSS